ncbi:MAG: hypothetical protein R3E48_02095 [Burkholderiaceae bacterium]
MDALYGRTFSLHNMSRAVLDHLDDLFGPLSLETVSQTIDFARTRGVTDIAGEPLVAWLGEFGRRWAFPTLCLHGAENRLTDPTTVFEMERLLRVRCEVPGSPPLRYRVFEGMGHQDSVIGRRTREVGDVALAFYREHDGWVPAPAIVPLAPPGREQAPDGGIGHLYLPRKLRRENIDDGAVCLTVMAFSPPAGRLTGLVAVALRARTPDGRIERCPAVPIRRRTLGADAKPDVAAIDGWRLEIGRSRTARKHRRAPMSIDPLAGSCCASTTPSSMPPTAGR